MQSPHPGTAALVIWFPGDRIFLVSMENTHLQPRATPSRIAVCSAVRMFYLGTLERSLIHCEAGKLGFSKKKLLGLGQTFCLLYLSSLPVQNTLNRKVVHLCQITDLSLKMSLVFSLSIHCDRGKHRDSRAMLLHGGCFPRCDSFSFSYPELQALFFLFKAAKMPRSWSPVQGNQVRKTGRTATERIVSLEILYKTIPRSSKV